MNHDDNQNQDTVEQVLADKILAKHLQINSGNEQRVAGQDYHENIINHFNDAKVLMLTLDEKKLDQLSIDSGNNFLYRFGKDFNPNLRNKVIALKQQHHWTEREVKRLLANGGISVNRSTEEVKLYQEFASYVFGWVFITLISAYYMMFIILISIAPNIVAWKQVSAQLVVAGICAGTLWVFNWLIISPYRILQRAKIATSTN